MTDTDPRKRGYYTRTGKKVGDFCIGFFGSMAGIAVAQFPVFFLSTISQTEALFIILPLLFLGLLIWAIVHFFRSGRRYISIGIITAIIIPLIAFGACVAFVVAAFSSPG